MVADFLRRKQPSPCSPRSRRRLGIRFRSKLVADGNDQDANDHTQERHRLSLVNGSSRGPRPTTFCRLYTICDPCQAARNKFVPLLAILVKFITNSSDHRERAVRVRAVARLWLRPCRSVQYSHTFWASRYCSINLRLFNAVDQVRRCHRTGDAGRAQSGALPLKSSCIQVVSADVRRASAHVLTFSVSIHDQRCRPAGILVTIRLPRGLAGLRVQSVIYRREAESDRRQGLQCNCRENEKMVFAAEPISPLFFTNKILAVEDAILAILRAPHRLVIDHEHKLFSFAKGGRP